MQRVRRISSLLLAGLLLGTGEVRAEPPSEARQIRRLVEQLSAPSFLDRESAERALHEFGSAALRPLRRIAEPDDLELRYRIERLVEHLERVAVEEALEAVLRGDATADFSELPGWRRFRAEVGDDRPARELFAEMVRCEPLLMRAADGPAERLNAVLERRCADLNVEALQQTPHQTAPATAAAVLFAGTHPECRLSTAASGCINDQLQRGGFRNALSGARQGGALRKLLGSWISRPDTSTALQRMNLAAQFDLPQGIDAAREILESRTVGAQQVQHALFFIARRGGPQHLRDLERLLGDETELATRRQGDAVTYTCRLQDAALAGLLHMTEQDPADYGFDQIRSSPQSVFVPGTTGFSSEQQRQRALRKWGAWRARHLKEVQPVEKLAVEGAAT